MVVVMALTSAAVILGFGTFALRARKRPVVSGMEQLPGMSGVVACVNDEGLWVRVNGELWQARRAPIAAGARQPHGLHAGDAVHVSGRDGLTLLVEPNDPQDKT
jgi:membrane-bound serine protease (ClpP class)